MKQKAALIILFLFSFFPVLVSSVLLTYEGFDYRSTDAANKQTGGVGWATEWNASNEYSIGSGSLSHAAALPTIGGHLEDTGTNLRSISRDVDASTLKYIQSTGLWFGFQASLESYTTRSNLLTATEDSTSLLIARTDTSSVFSVRQELGNGNYVGLSFKSGSWILEFKGNNGLLTTVLSGIPTGGNHLFAFNLSNINTRTGSYRLDLYAPTTSDGIGSQSLLASLNNSLSSISSNQKFMIESTKVDFDEIRYGTTAADIVKTDSKPAPEPTSLVALAVGALTFFAQYRKKRS